jgi:hypothetical protein
LGVVASDLSAIDSSMVTHDLKAADSGFTTHDAGGTAAPSPFIDTANGIHAFLTFDYRLTAAQVPQVAPRYDFVWGASRSYVAAFHAANPKMIVSFYMTFDEEPGCNLSCAQASHPDWVLYQCDKTTPVTYPGTTVHDVDISNPAVQSWQLQQVQTAAGNGYDGIAFDIFQLNNVRNACGIWRNGQWVQLYTGNRVDSKYTSDVLAWLHNMYSSMHALKKPMLLIPNYVLDYSLTDPATAQLIANVDAVLDEEANGNYGYYTVDTRWTDREQFARTLQQAGKAYYSLSGFNTVDSAAINWSLASYLLEKDHAAAIYIASASGAQYGSDAWHNEYAAAVGTACGATAAQQGGYARTFSHGLAVANPSSTATVKFTLPAGSYKDLYGATVSGTVTLGPHSGIVLLRNDAPNC